MSTPQTTIQICSGVRLNNKYDHTILFTTRQVQVEYFQSKVTKTFTGYAYLRKRWTIKVAATMGEARAWSYLYFRNPDPNPARERWAFYFINDVEYVNDATVELTLELDVMQTYAFDYTLQDCFVEREHSATDAVGENTIDEGLDTGELVPVSVADTDDISGLCVLILSSIDLATFNESGEELRILGMNLDGVFSGLGLYAVSMTQHTKLQTLLNNLDEKGLTDAVVSMWMYPKNLTGQTSWDEGNAVKRVGGGYNHLEYAGENPTTLAGQYEPKNAKLLQYPYSLLYATNNNGGATVYRFEWFDNEDGAHTFRIDGSLVGDACVKLTPEGYHHTNESYMYDDGLVLSGFPTCAWNSDTYKLWLAQNQNQHDLARATAGLQMVAGVGMMAAGGIGMATGVGALMGGGSIAGGVSMVASGVQQIAGLNAQSKDYDVQPPAARGQQSASINISTGKQCFTLIHKSVDECHAKRIDDYFTMYGYKTCRVKTPNVDSRPHFNYVKTVASNVRGDICHADLATINAVFDRGVTFWKNGDEIGDYSVDNRPT